MKRTKYNLNVINNFILHYTHDNPENCDEMYQAAKDYIQEDHVDGENMPEEDNEIFFLNDMEQSFEAGETYERGNWTIANNDELKSFNEWMDQTHNTHLSTIC